MSSYKEFMEKGFVTLVDTYSRGVIDDLSTAATLYQKRTQNRRGKAGNAAHKLYRTENLLYDFLVPELLNNVLLLELIEQIYPEGFQLQEVLLYFSQPNGSFQQLHRDIDHTYTNHFDILPPLTAVQVPLVPFNVATGGTRLIVGSHRTLTAPPDLEQEDLAKVMARTPTIEVGNCLVRDARVWHGAGINKSEQVRSMFTLAFAPLLSETLPSTVVSSDVYFNLNRQARKLVAPPTFFTSLI